MTQFLKMHGLGNDFTVFDARKQGLTLGPAEARAIADRRRGVGCDQIIVIAPASDADAEMRILNADGSEAEACGNAARCVAQVLMAEKSGEDVRLSTKGGLLSCRDSGDGLITVDMGAPTLVWDKVPLSKPADTNGFALNVDGVPHLVSAVSMGNPHCVLFVEDAEAAPVAELGPRIETHPMFPARTNVEFAQVVSRGRLRMRVWERGAGVTQACGSGACAATVAAHRRGLTDRKVEVLLDGGILVIEIADGHVLMTGPASLSYRGDVDIEGLLP